VSRCRGLHALASVMSHPSGSSLSPRERSVCCALWRLSMWLVLRENVCVVSNMMASASNGWSEHGGFPSIGLPQQTTSEALHGVMEGCLPLRAYPNASSFHSPAEAAFALNGGSGCATSFPVGITLGATFNRSLWRSIGHAIGTEGRAYHNLRQGAGVIYWTPDVNLIRDP
jgi:hypothetical protein